MTTNSHKEYQMEEHQRIAEFIRLAKENMAIARPKMSFFTEWREGGNLPPKALEDINKAEEILCDLQNAPHAFVLGCVMDLGIVAEKAWIIPYKVFSALLKLGRIKDNSINELSRVSLEDYQFVFKEYYKNNLHRFNYMAERFRDAILLIKNKYQSNAALIWTGRTPLSSDVLVRRFREFNGVGQKISTMAVNILVRRFDIKLSDYRDIEMSLDSQVIKVMDRLGFITAHSDEKAVKKEILEKTRTFHPEYPGVFDRVCWFVGWDYCHNTAPDCQNCVLKSICRKIVHEEQRR